MISFIRPCDTANSCVETAVEDTKMATPSGRSCGEAACVVTNVDPDQRTVLVRDGKLGESSPILRFNMAEWAAFRQAIIAGRLNYDECSRVTE